jgi:ABC-type sulfate/molybdate transport systems ATPase subunit
VEDLLKARLAEGAAILIVTHDHDQARRLAKRALIIERGTIREGAP